MHKVTLDAFQVADVVQEDYVRNGFDNVEGLLDLIAEEPIGDSSVRGIEEDSSFDP